MLAPFTHVLIAAFYLQFSKQTPWQLLISNWVTNHWLNKHRIRWRPTMTIEPLAGSALFSKKKNQKWELLTKCDCGQSESQCQMTQSVTNFNYNGASRNSQPIRVPYGLGQFMARIPSTATWQLLSRIISSRRIMVCVFQWDLHRGLGEDRMITRCESVYAVKRYDCMMTWHRCSLKTCHREIDSTPFASGGGNLSTN